MKNTPSHLSGFRFSNNDVDGNKTENAEADGCTTFDEEEKIKVFERFVKSLKDAGWDKQVEEAMREVEKEGTKGLVKQGGESKVGLWERLKADEVKPQTEDNDKSGFSFSFELPVDQEEASDK
jgi:hypothetical protein